LRFHDSDNPSVIAYSKRDGDDIILVACTLDPYREQEATIGWDMPALGMDWNDRFIARDELTGHAWTWSQGTYVKLGGAGQVAHIAQITVPA